jgi:hypothetical protein
MIILLWQETMNQSQYINEFLGDKMTQYFSSEVHSLADKLVLIVAHPLGGSRANRHHTPNPQPGAAQPTQDEIHKLRAIH